MPARLRCATFASTFRVFFPFFLAAPAAAVRPALLFAATAGNEKRRTGSFVLTQRHKRKPQVTAQRAATKTRDAATSFRSVSYLLPLRRVEFNLLRSEKERREEGGKS